eukprot:TRINITY_DN108670_c0_g1_i1.p1 TRINITY_DN108670_c0_g1~~TRINITY_DN108670_c0_g1_i1.p1  ORF type:complete len:297 (-),score=64.06 TRINITY_DN108670_c0_g1_i1:44-934(-)
MPKDAEEDEDGFSITTSGEFCHGSSRRSRGGSQELRHEVLEEVEEESAWQVELAADEMPEVLQLLLQVPPGLRRRYCDRVRSEERRRLAASERVTKLEEVLRSRRRRLPCLRQLFVALVVVAFAIMLLPQFKPDERKPAELHESRTLLSSSLAEGTGKGRKADNCTEALERAEERAGELETLSRRDILGYQQMLTSVNDWMTNIKSQTAPGTLAFLAPCLTLEATRYLDTAARLKASMLAAHARTARQRARLNAERQARLALKDGHRQHCNWEQPSTASTRGASRVHWPLLFDKVQ